MEELIFAIPTEKLWKLLAYTEQGLIKANIDALIRIVQQGLFRKRGDLEADPSFKQIIPYAIISNNESFYLFKRTSGQKENRLHNKLTLGVGGHMNPGNSEKSAEQYLINELKREFFEEVKPFNACSIENIEFIGFINDDTVSVGRVHIGLLYNITVSNQDLIVNETDKMTAEWIDKPGLYRMYEELETWTQIAFENYIK